MRGTIFGTWGFANSIRAIIDHVWVELQGSGQDGKTVRERVSKRETRPTLAASASAD